MPAVPADSVVGCVPELAMRVIWVLGLEISGRLEIKQLGDFTTTKLTWHL